MPQTESYRVKFSGDYACFSRPEFKVERVSYPVMTPSAARGALEAVFWKPEIRWEIRRIEVLEPIRTQTILRNEVAHQQSPRKGTGPFVVDRRRQQRSSLILRDVSYIVEADMIREPHADAPIPKWTSQFERRLERGQCFHRPYLGTREFPASFTHADGNEAPVDDNRQIGTMLFDIARIPDEERAELSFHRHGPDGATEVKGRARPLFFEAELVDGVLEVPPELYEELRELEAG